MEKSKGDKVDWYCDRESKNISGIIEKVSERILDGEPIYTIRADDGILYFLKERTFITKNPAIEQADFKRVSPDMADKIPMTNIYVQKHGNLTSHISMNSSDFFSTITMATNYASDKLEELRTKGMGHLVLSDPGLDTKITKIKESYDYWENEYERLSKIRADLR